MGKHPDLSGDAYEGLATLFFLWWYGNHREIRNVLRMTDNDEGKLDNQLQELPYKAMEEAWTNRWFAKGDLTDSVDKYIVSNFAWLLHDDVLEQKKKYYKPKTLWEKLALIILFDQITRNAFRGTPAAYQCDSIALPIALELMGRKLPFHFRATVAICLCHVESKEVQEFLAHYISSRPIHPLEIALVAIARKHRERIQEFERFPERNLVLKRCNTAREESYLLQLI